MAKWLTLEEHFIKWIVLETAQGSQRKELKAGEQPQAVFMLTDCDKPVAATAWSVERKRINPLSSNNFFQAVCRFFV